MVERLIAPKNIREPGGSNPTVKAFFVLGLLAAASTVGAYEMTGGVYRVTRDDVNAGGLFQAGGTYLLNGSVSGIESVSAADVTQIKSGFEAVQDYPGTIVDVQLSTRSVLSANSGELDLRWTAPAAEVLMNQESTLYIIKYASGPISTQAVFAATTTYDQSIDPTAPGSQESLTLTGLIANTSYYVAIEAQDRDQNQAYLSVGASTVPVVTLSPIPGFVFVLESSQTYIRIQWQSDNPYPGTPVKYEAQITDVPDFSSITSFNIFNSTVQFSTGTTFSGLTSGTSYYMRVRSFNRVNAPSVWAYSSSTSTSLGTPGMPFFRDITITSLTAFWAPLSGAIYSVEEWENPDFIGIPKDIKMTGTTPSATFTGLNHNTTYWYRVQGSVNGQATAYGDSNFTMTAVNAVTPTGYTINKTSASFTWTDGFNQNNLPISYRVEISTRSNFTPLFTSSTILSSASFPHAAPYSSTSTVLIPNTTYYYRVMALNGIGNPTTSYFINAAGGPRATDPVVPDGINFQSVSFTQFLVSWFENAVAPDNPVGGSNGTQYEVKVTTGADADAPAVDYVITKSTDPQTHVFDQNLFANTTYFVSVRAKGRSVVNNTDSDWLTVSTVTRPTSVTNPSFAVDLTSATLFWETTNGLTTEYEVELLRDGFQLATSTTYLTNTTFAEAFNVALATNTTYNFRIHTTPNGNWPEPAYVQVTTSTLADIPAFAASTFTAVSSNTISVQWGLNTNPSDTTFRVKYSTDNFVSSLFTQDVVATTSTVLTGLLSDTTYWVRVSAVNRIGRETADLDLGNIVTLANLPIFTSFVVGITSITVSWNPNSNSPTTVYQTTSSLVADGSLVHTNNNIVGTSWTDAGLSVNTPYTFSIRAVNKSGVPTAWAVLGSTWTLAATPPQPSLPVLDTPNSLIMSFSQGTNPLGSPGGRTQFAIQIIYDGYGVAAQNITNHFISPVVSDGANIHAVSASTNIADSSNWGTYSEWQNGVFVATGLNPGTNIFYAVYARNGDNGSEPRIPTSPSVSQQGYTYSGTPVVLLGDITADASQSAQVWVNTLVTSFTATGAYHYHFQLGTVYNQSGMTISHPGWHGTIQAGTMYADEVSDADYNGGVIGFRVPGEGEYYLNILGDDYPFSAQFGLPPNQHSNGPLNKGTPFEFYVDLQKPAVQDITAQFTSTVSVPIFSGVATPAKMPFFKWNTINTVGTSASYTSPIVGYNYSLSTDPSVNPSTGTVDPSVSFTAQSQFAYTASVEITTPAVYGNTYFFKVSAKDQAGNWSDPVTFIYMPRPDTEFPRVLNVAYGGVLVPSSGAGVAVSTTPLINVQFSKRMHGPTMEADGFYLQGTMDKSCNPISHQIPLTITYSTLTRTADMAPQAVLEDGYHYELVSSTKVIDEAGNPLYEQVQKKFWTLMDPNTDNCHVDDDGSGTKVLFPQNAWGPWPAGNAINSNPLDSPMAAPALPNIIVNANDTARRIAGEFAQPIAIKEFNLYNAAGQRVSGVFNTDVTLVMPYPDANDDGIVDDTNPPVRANALVLSWLDEETGIWVRVPGSVVDVKAKTITTPIRHFSVYGIIGTPSMDLSNAYAFPVPFKPSLGHRQIGFKNLSDVGVIRVYTINGELVRELPISASNQGILYWDVTNSSGEPVASDVYLYLIQNDQQKKTGKLMIVR